MWWWLARGIFSGVCQSDHELMTNTVCGHAIVAAKLIYSNAEHFIK